MKQVTAIVDSKITLPKEDLDEQILGEIRGALMMVNPTRETAKKEQIGGWWNIPEFIDLYKEDDTNLYLPRGFANQLVEGMEFHEIGIDFRDNRIVSPVGFSYSTVDVRGYQDKAIQSIIACEQGVWEAPPGAGKTVSVLEAIRRLGQRALIVVDKTNIAQQWRLRAQTFLGGSIGMLGDNEWDLLPVSVALQQSLWAKREQLDEEGFFDQWGFICLDECFPAGTKVNGIPIELLSCGDIVDTHLGPRKIISIFKKTPEFLVRLRLNDESDIICTPGHPVFTENGWLPAILCQGEKVYGRSEMSLVRQNNCLADQASERPMEESWKGLLLEKMLNGIQKKEKFRNHVCNEQNLCLYSDDSEQSNEKFRNKNEGFSNIETNGSQTINQRREWKGNDHSRVYDVFSHWVNSYNNRMWKESEKTKTSKSFQDRYWRQRIDVGCRNRWSITQFVKKKRARHKKASMAGESRVESVEVLEPRSDGKFGGLCPDGYVYNLHVEEAETYFVNDVLVHNCHHFPANTFTEILGRFSAKYRIGVSGTPYKQPGQDDLIWSTLGPRFHQTSKQELRKGGWLIKPEVVIWKTDFKADFWPTHQGNVVKKSCMFKYCTVDKTKARHQNNYADVMNQLIDNKGRTNLVASNVARELNQGHCILVLSKRLDHLDNIFDAVSKIVGTSENLFKFTGKQNTKQRMEIQERADGGNCVLFSTIADEALDIPRISRIHLAWPTRNTGTTKQQIGRGERPHPLKSDTIINDYFDNVGPLRGQIADRVNDVYIPEGLTIRGGEDLIR